MRGCSQGARPSPAPFSCTRMPVCTPFCALGGAGGLVLACDPPPPPSSPLSPSTRAVPWYQRRRKFFPMPTARGTSALGVLKMPRTQCGMRMRRETHVRTTRHIPTPVDCRWSRRISGSIPGPFGCVSICTARGKAVSLCSALLVPQAPAVTPEPSSRIQDYGPWFGWCSCGRHSDRGSRWLDC